MLFVRRSRDASVRKTTDRRPRCDRAREPGGAGPRVAPLRGLFPLVDRSKRPALRDGRRQPLPYEYYATLPASSVDSTALDMAQLLIALLGDGSNDHGRLMSAAGARRTLARQHFPRAYAGMLDCHTCREGEGWARSDHPVRGVGPGILEIFGRRFLAVEPLLFVREDGRVRVCFREDERGRITHRFDSGSSASGYEKPGE